MRMANQVNIPDIALQATVCMKTWSVAFIDGVYKSKVLASLSKEISKIVNLSCKYAIATIEKTIINCTSY